MYSEKEILKNRAKALKSVPKQKPFTEVEKLEFKKFAIKELETFDEKAYVIYDVVLNELYLSTDSGDGGQSLGLFVIGKFWR